MDLSSFALLLYESEILICVRATANARGRVKSHGLSAVFKQIAIQRDASRVYTGPSKKGYLVIFLLSTVCHFHDDGIRGYEDLGSGEGDSWQIAASAVIHQSWINRRPWLVLFLPLSPSLTLTLFLCLSFSALFLSSYFFFFTCVSIADGYFRCLRTFRSYLARPRELSHKLL